MPNNRLHCTALVPPQTLYHRGVQCFDVVLYEEPCVCTGNCIGHWALGIAAIRVLLCRVQLYWAKTRKRDTTGVRGKEAYKDISSINRVAWKQIQL